MNNSFTMKSFSCGASKKPKRANQVFKPSKPNSGKEKVPKLHVPPTAALTVFRTKIEETMKVKLVKSHHAKDDIEDIADRIRKMSIHRAEDAEPAARSFPDDPQEDIGMRSLVEKLNEASFSEQPRSLPQQPVTLTAPVPLPLGFPHREQPQLPASPDAVQPQTECTHDEFEEYLLQTY